MEADASELELDRRRGFIAGLEVTTDEF